MQDDFCIQLKEHTGLLVLSPGFCVAMTVTSWLIEVCNIIRGKRNFQDHFGFQPFPQARTSNPLEVSTTGRWRKRHGVFSPIFMILIKNPSHGGHVGFDGQVLDAK